MYLKISKESYKRTKKSQKGRLIIKNGSSKYVNRYLKSTRYHFHYFNDFTKVVIST